MIPRILILSSLLTVASGWPPSLHGQELPTSEFGELVEVSEVLVDVLVTDRKGQVVLGLTEEDFVVRDGGQEMTLTGVSFYSNRFLLKEDSPERIQHPNEVPADRHFIFFFQDLRRLGSDLQSAYMRQQLESVRDSQQWVREEMLPGDWVAVVSFDVKLKVHSDFSQDREALVRALQDAARGRDPRNEWPTRREFVPDGRPTLLGRLPSGKELRRQSRRMYDGLRLIAETSRDIPGRKNILLFTIGFGELDGSRPFAEADSRYYPAMRDALNDNNVAVYPIDLTPRAFDTLQANFLYQLAGDSGGTYYEKHTSFISPLRRIADENNGYYLLSYRAEHPAGETGYRQIEVEAINRDFRLRARRGYRYGG